ncbi:hypothetical protein C0J52_28244 [Blattella germanica]|nr:hypothetical protein C0J52_28244 [Blattella germanica]
MSFMIKSADSGLVLDVKECNRKNGAEIILYPFNGGNNQLWTYKNGKIISKLNGERYTALRIM